MHSTKFKPHEIASALPISERMFSVDEAGAICRRGRNSIYNHIAAGELKSVKLGKRRLIAGSELQRFVGWLASQAT